MLPVFITEHVITRSIPTFKTLPEVFQCRKMNCFQGSAQPNFISFCLVSQNEDESLVQTNTATNILAESVQTPVLASTFNAARNPVPSPPPFPSSTDSNMDVTAYAEEQVCLHEEAQQLAEQQNREQTAWNPVEEEEEEEK